MAPNQFVRTPAGLQRAGRPVNSRIASPSPQGTAPVQESPQEGADTDETTSERLVRVSRKGDKFHIDPRAIPDGWSYEWKRLAVYGQPDPDHMINLKANHWRPVPATRHPNLLPGLMPGQKAQAVGEEAGVGGCIIKDGMILMERPLYLTIDAQQEDYEIATGKVLQNEREIAGSTGNPTLDRQTGIRKSYRPILAEE